MDTEQMSCSPELHPGAFSPGPVGFHVSVCVHVCVSCPLVVKGCNDIFVHFEVGAVLLCGHWRTL